MAAPLKNVEDVTASNLANEIEQWLQGRELYDAGEYQQAVTVYSLVIEVMNDRNPGIYFDRGLAYTGLGKPDQALADFEMVLKLNEALQNRIGQLVTNDPALYEQAIEAVGSYPEVVALVPLPTHTPTSTPLPTSTPSPWPTAAPPTPTNSESPVSAATVAPATPSPTLPPTSTPPPPSSTPTVTPTPTPPPAIVVYVQSNGQNHDLGLVTSSAELLDASLHRRAAAPAWSPDGSSVAFYGEPGISEFGGVYAQGSGVWLIELQTGQVSLLFQIDHIFTMDWSSDGAKLALEVGPPGVAHQVYVIDARDGQEISRFPGQQPAWKPNGQELVIKSCAPECGLWQVDLNGQGGRLLTRDSTDSYPAWSPAGDYLVFTSRSRTGDWELYQLRLTENEPIQLTNRSGTDTTPVFSPDGIEIYFRTDAFGAWEVRAMAVDGSNERVIRANVGPSDDWGRARPAVY
jgi:hypothetical protein